METLRSLKIDYMVSGSIVSSLQGEPRATHDIDIVVAVPPSSAKDLAAAFPAPGYYLSEESIVEALDSRGMFNLIDVDSGDTIDFWILTDRQFDVSRFHRKYVERVMGMQIAVSAPEDTILMKLLWARESGGSEKQFTDALRVFEVQYRKLDVEYLRDWARRLDIYSLLEKLEEEADTL